MTREHESGANMKFKSIGAEDEDKFSFFPFAIHVTLKQTAVSLNYGNRFWYDATCNTNCLLTSNFRAILFGKSDSVIKWEQYVFIP